MKYCIILLSIISLNLFADNNYEKASALVKDKKYSEALEPLSKYIKDNPKDDKAYNLLGVVHRSLGTVEHIKKAEEYFFRALSLNDNNNEARINLASISYQLGHNEKAIILFNDALRIDKNNIKALEALAVILLGLDRIGDAKTFYKRLYKNAPKKKGVNMGLGIIALKEKMIADARKYFSQEAQISKDDPEVFFNLAVAYEYDLKGVRGGKGADFDDALKNYEKALKLDPEYVNALFACGVIYSKRKEYKKAIEKTLSALKYAKDFAMAYYNLACYYSLDGQKDNAVKNLKKGIELGYRDFEHIEKDKDLDAIRNTSEYKELIKKYKKKTDV